MTNAPERSIAEGLRWVEPRNWGHLGAHSFRLDAVPGEEFMLIFPEWLTSRETVLLPKFAWNRLPATARWQEGPYSLTISLRAERSDRSIGIAWEYLFRNEASARLTDLAAFNCLNLDAAPGFKDLAMERTWVSDADGQKICLRDVAKTQGPGKRTMQFYPVLHGMDPTLTAKISGYGVTSPARLSGDRIGVLSKSGDWLIESIVDGPLACLFNNWEADHGCIHAAPLFGDVAPASEAGVRGSVRFTRAGRPAGLQRPGPQVGKA